MCLDRLFWMAGPDLHHVVGKFERGQVHQSFWGGGGGGGGGQETMSVAYNITGNGPSLIEGSW
jgi:hypothetical protein